MKLIHGEGEVGNPRHFTSCMIQEVSHAMVAFVALDTQSGNMDPESLACAQSSWTRVPWGMCGTWMLSAVYSPCLLSLRRNRWKGRTSCDSKTAFSLQLPKSDRQLTLPPVSEARLSWSHKWNWKTLISPSSHTRLSQVVDMRRGTRRCGLSRKNTGLWTLLCQCPHAAGHPCITVHDPLFLLLFYIDFCGGTAD